MSLNPLAAAEESAGHLKDPYLQIQCVDSLCQSQSFSFNIKSSSDPVLHIVIYCLHSFDVSYLEPLGAGL